MKLAALTCGLFIGLCSGQTLNVIPELFRNYVNEYPELQTFNLLANISEVLFSSAKYEASVNFGEFEWRVSITISTEIKS